MLDDQLTPEALHQPISKLDRLRKVVARIDVQERNWKLARRKRLDGQTHHHNRVFPPREQESRPLKLCGDFTHDENRLGFEVREMAAFVDGHRADKSGYWAGNTLTESAEDGATWPHVGDGETRTFAEVGAHPANERQMFLLHLPELARESTFATSAELQKV